MRAEIDGQGFTRVAALFGGSLMAPSARARTAGTLDEAVASRLAELALACVHREYPNQISHTLQRDADARPPRELTPAFYGCYDWHSSVHGHWLLARLAQGLPETPIAERARAALTRTLTSQNIAGEVAYLSEAGRAAFERPYGLAWLLALAAELRSWDDPQARQWSQTLRPLETAAAKRFTVWLPKLRYPIRTGEHSQSAFAFGLIHDWAAVAGAAGMLSLLEVCARAHYLRDRNGPLSYEPSGQDLLSPCLAEADFMRRILPPDEFSKWLKRFLPSIPVNGRADWLAPGEGTDRSDPKLAHIDGLNLSRAWMLQGIASGLPPDDPRLGALCAAAAAHATAALPAVTSEHYEGGHWLGTFAVYLLTDAGLRRT